MPNAELLSLLGRSKLPLSLLIFAFIIIFSLFHNLGSFGSVHLLVEGGGGVHDALCHGQIAQVGAELALVGVLIDHVSVLHVGDVGLHHFIGILNVLFEIMLLQFAFKQLALVEFVLQILLEIVLYID